VRARVAPMLADAPEGEQPIEEDDEAQKLCTPAAPLSLQEQTDPAPKRADALAERQAKRLR
jgi:hypothetical protein